MRVFHYARDRWIERITNDGFLKLTGAEAAPGVQPSLLPGLVWLTKSEQVPHTCSYPPEGMIQYVFDSDNPKIQHWPLVKKKILAGVTGYVLNKYKVSKKWNVHPDKLAPASAMAEGLDKYAVEAGDDPDDFYVSLKRLSPTDCLEMNETPERIQAQARGEMVQVEDKITREIYITYRPIVAGGDMES